MSNNQDNVMHVNTISGFQTFDRTVQVPGRVQDQIPIKLGQKED